MRMNTCHPLSEALRLNATAEGLGFSMRIKMHTSMQTTAVYQRLTTAVLRNDAGVAGWLEKTLC